jgi:hypothetical protein
MTRADPATPRAVGSIGRTNSARGRFVPVFARVPIGEFFSTEPDPSMDRKIPGTKCQRFFPTLVPKDLDLSLP